MIMMNRKIEYSAIAVPAQIRVPLKYLLVGHLFNLHGFLSFRFLNSIREVARYLLFLHGLT